MIEQDEPSAAVSALLSAGRYLDAVKQLREERGLGLKDAKQTIDDYLRRYPARFPNARQPSGCGAGLVFVLLGLALLAAFILGARFG